MAEHKDLVRFLEAQNHVYLKALDEIKSGQKRSHWMWYIFPQIKGLGSSENARFFGIKSLDEATAYVQHPILGKHLIEITKALLTIEGKSASDIFGYPDDLKLHSSMTLFSKVENADSVFNEVLKKYFKGVLDQGTLQILEE
jgi:uncharacterized protein (DUF1810 family)